MRTEYLASERLSPGRVGADLVADGRAIAQPAVTFMTRDSLAPGFLSTMFISPSREDRAQFT